MKLFIATTNKGKLREFKTLLPLSFLLQSPSNLEQIDAPEETGQTFVENAILKAKYYSNAFQIPALADDSGLVVPSLNGEPGVFSARYAGPNATDELNIEKLLHELNGIQERAAWFECAISVSLPNGETHTFSGKCQGHIAYEPNGSDGFGYDPIFIPEGYQSTFAQLEVTEKNKISHRGKALEKLKEFIQNNPTFCG